MIKRIEQLSMLNFERIISLPRSKYRTIGIIKKECVRSLSALQLWWANLSESDRDDSLILLNYTDNLKNIPELFFTEEGSEVNIDFSQKDIKTENLIHKVEEDKVMKEETVFDKLLNIFPNSVERMTEVCRVLTTSSYQISRRQLELYLLKYSKDVKQIEVSE